MQAAVDAVAGLNEAYYENFDVIADELAAANEVLADGKATQEQVNEALTNLEAAKAELIMKDAEYGKVDAAIAEAEKLNKKDYKDFSKVEEAIAAVVRGKKIDEQTEVDAMAQRSEDAIAALEKSRRAWKTGETGKTWKARETWNPKRNRMEIRFR